MPVLGRRYKRAKLHAPALRGIAQIAKNSGKTIEIKRLEQKIPTRIERMQLKEKGFIVEVNFPAKTESLAGQKPDKVLTNIPEKKLGMSFMGGLSPGDRKGNLVCVGVVKVKRPSSDEVFGIAYLVDRTRAHGID